MKQLLTDILSDLCTTPGPSGFEREIAQKAKDYLSPYCDEIAVDAVGRITWERKGARSGIFAAAALAAAGSGLGADCTACEKTL